MKYTNDLLLEIVGKIAEAQTDRAWRIESILQFYNADDIKISSGATKFCLIIPTVDFVIKWSKDIDNEDTVREISIYEDSVANHLDCFFPKTELFAEIDGYAFVKQEKIDYAACDMRYTERRRYEKISRTVPHNLVEKMNRGVQLPNCDYCRQLDYLWAKVVISLYGKKCAKDLCDFIQKHYISDLHKANIGYKNHRPVILDFCGYFGSC